MYKLFPQLNLHTLYSATRLCLTIGALSACSLAQAEPQTQQNQATPEATDQRTLMQAVSTAATTAQDAFSRGLLEGKVESLFAFNKHLSGYSLDAKLNNSTLEISGKVASELERDFAEQLAYSVDGVMDVTNSILVNKDTKKTTFKSTTEQVAKTLKDTTVTANIKAKLLANQQVSGLAVHVKTVNRKVTLKGKASSELEKDLIEVIARNTHGVAEVHNEILVENK